MAVYDFDRFSKHDIIGEIRIAMQKLIIFIKSVALNYKNFLNFVSHEFS